MNELKHNSPSAVNRFVRCASNWLLHYDEEDGVKTRNDFSDAGILSHEALEVFYDPRNGYDIENFKQLEEIFKDVCRRRIFRENLFTYKRAYDMLVAGYRMEMAHPIVPREQRKTLSVEQPLLAADDGPWQLPGWPLPVVGYIDRISLRGTSWDDPERFYDLILHDTKTGYHKSREEIIQDDVAASIYFLYARRTLVPYLEAQHGIKIGSIIGLWEYIAHDLCIVLEESDFDPFLTEAYVENISHQMLELKEQYIREIILRTSVENSEREIRKWMIPYERPNPFCGYCPRKNSCHSFQNLLKHEGIIDLDNANWEEIWKERELQAALAKSSKQRLDEINDLIKFSLDWSGEKNIPVPELGISITANRQKWKKYKIDGVRRLFGDDFVFRNVEISNETIQAELNAITRTNPERAKEITAALGTAYTMIPGSRPVRAQRMGSLPKPSKGDKPRGVKFKK